MSLEAYVERKGRAFLLANPKATGDRLEAFLEAARAKYLREHPDEARCPTFAKIALAAAEAKRVRKRRAKAS